SGKQRCENGPGGDEIWRIVDSGRVALSASRPFCLKWSGSLSRLPPCPDFRKNGGQGCLWSSSRRDSGVLQEIHNGSKHSNRLELGFAAGMYLQSLGGCAAQRRELA